MNVFFLDRNPALCAEYHCDKHVSKMILESAQLISTTMHTLDIEGPYRPTHHNHPCRIWAGKSQKHINWLLQLMAGLNFQYRVRYGKQVDHLSYQVIKKYDLSSLLPDNAWQDPPCCMPDECKISDNVVTCYRHYYQTHKNGFAQWRLGSPGWWNGMTTRSTSQSIRKQPA